MELAPIVLFVYKRPWHTEQTLRALSRNDLADESVLYVYSDSPRLLAAEEDVRQVEEVRRLIRSERWCKEVHVIEAPYNKGLVQSFVDGITEVVNRHGRVIVLEDDQVTSRGFLKFMNEALEIYKDDEKVMHVSGYMYPAKFESKETTFFLQIQSCPGWGTWKRAWKHYNHDAIDHLKYFSQSRELRRKFDIEGHAYFYRQLEKNAGPILYSWAVRWHASCIRARGLLLFPVRSLVRNIGCDDTGEHCGSTRMYDVSTVDYLPVKRIPIVEDMRIRSAVDDYYKSHLQQRFPNLPRRLRNAISGTVRLGVRILQGIGRRLVGMAIPELRQLDSSTAHSIGLLSSACHGHVSSKARLVAPYHLHGVNVGDYTYIMPGTWISMTSIGKFCSIGGRFACGGGIHPLDGISTSPMFYSTGMQNGMTLSGTNKCVERKPVIIGNDVFIGMNVTVLDGVTIGDGAVIGAGCVVSKDVPPYAIVVGNPMRILRYRFPEELRLRLRATRWWDFDEERLKEVEQLWLDVEEFVRRCESATVRPAEPPA